MKELVNTVRKTELHVLIGLAFVATVILPCIAFIIINIINGNFNNW